MGEASHCQCGHRIEQHAIDRGYCHVCKCQKYDNRIYTQAQFEAALLAEREKYHKLLELGRCALADIAYSEDLDLEDLPDRAEVAYKEILAGLGENIDG